MEADAQEDQDERQAEEGISTRPVARFSGTGGLGVAVWKRKVDGVDRFSVRLERSYKDDQGEYQNSSYLRASDLLRAGKLLEQADAWIEQEKGRARGAIASPDSSRSR